MCTSVPQIPVRSTLINTSLIPIFGCSTSSSHSPGSRRLFTSAFTTSTISHGSGARAKIGSVPRLLLFAATTGYQIRVFAAAARRLGFDLTLATNRCHVLEDPWEDRAIPVKFERIAESLDVLRGLHVDGIAAVGDQPAVLAAEAAQVLAAPFHPPAAADACRDKYLARQLYQAAGLRVPQFYRAALSDNPRDVAARAPFPCVLKPLGLSASRGVIRANNPEEFVAAFRRIAR